MAVGTIYTHALGEHVLRPFLLALVRPQLKSCDQFRSPQYKEIHGCAGECHKDVWNKRIGEEKELDFSTLKIKGQRD